MKKTVALEVPSGISALCLSLSRLFVTKIVLMPDGSERLAYTYADYQNIGRMRNVLRAIRASFMVGTDFGYFLQDFDSDIFVEAVESFRAYRGTGGRITAEKLFFVERALRAVIEKRSFDQGYLLQTGVWLGSVGRHLLLRHRWEVSV